MRKNSTIRLLCFVLPIQLLFIFCFLFFSEPFVFSFPVADVLVIEVFNRPYALDIEVDVLGHDLGYLFRTGSDELSQFFPRFYWVIIAGRVLVKAVLLGLILFFLWRLVKNWNQQRFERISNFFETIRFNIFIASTLVFALISYFTLSRFATEQGEFQLRITQLFVATAISVGLMVVVARRQRLSEALKRFLANEQAPYSLAITRILFFTYSVFIHIGFDFNFGPNIGALDKQPLPGIAWLIDLIPVSSELYHAFAISGALFALLAAIGYRTRLFMVLHAITIFYVVATPNFFGKLWHQQLVIWISWILACSPCYNVLSIDALKRGVRSLNNVGYAFHLRVIWFHFGLIYFFAGMYKFWLCGFDWALSDSMVNQVRLEWFEHFDMVPSIRIDHFPTLLKVGGFGVIVFEISYMFFLFHRKLRWLSIVGGLIMHNMIGKIMYISFFGLLQVFYLVFIPWNQLLSRLGLIEKSAKTEKTVVINFRSIAVIIPLFILGMNVVHGIFRIDSYPFSVYPVYAEIVSDTVQYFDYRIQDKDFEQLDFRAEGRKHGFRWESYSRLEYAIIREYEYSGTLDSTGIRTMWKRWQLEVPTLKHIDSVEVYMVSRTLLPEEADKRLSEKYLMPIFSNQ